MLTLTMNTDALITFLCNCHHEDINKKGPEDLNISIPCYLESVVVKCLEMCISFVNSTVSTMPTELEYIYIYFP